MSVNGIAFEDQLGLPQYFNLRIGNELDGFKVVKLSLNLEHSSKTRGPSPISPYNAINADSNAYRKKDVYVSHCQPFITRFKSITR